MISKHANKGGPDPSRSRPSVFRTYLLVLPMVLLVVWLTTAVILELFKADNRRGQAGVPNALTKEEYLEHEEKLGIPSITFEPFRKAADWLFSCQPDLSLEANSTGGANSRGDDRFASWYLSPQQQLFGYFFYSILFIGSIVGGLMRGRWEVRAPARDDGGKMSKIPAGRNLVELLNAIATTLLALGAICYKCATAILARRENSPSADVMANWFLLQPCHVFCILLAAIYWSRRSKFSMYFFNVYLHLMWGVALALVFAEMEEYYKRQYPLEIFHFYLEHWLLVLAPFVLIALRTYPIFKPRLWFCYSFAAVFHCCILQPIHFVVLVQINYQTHPPGGPLRHFGKLYRPVQYAFCWLLTYLFSQCIIPTWVSFCEAHIWPRLGLIQHNGIPQSKESGPRVFYLGMSATVDSLVKTILKGGSAGEVTRQLSWVKNANGVGKRGITPLIAAIECEDDEILSAVLENKKVAVNVPDEEMGLPPIIHAVRHGGSAVVPLIKRGANLKATDEGGQNVAHWACRTEYDDKESGYRLDFRDAAAEMTGGLRNFETGFIALTRRSRVALRYLEFDLESMLNEPSVIKVLSKADPCIFSAIDEEGNTPLHVGLLEGQQEAVYAVLSPESGLLEHLDLNKKNESGETPLLVAVKMRMANAVQLLIDTGKADANVRDEEGNTALHIAVRNNMSAVEALLLEGGADKSIKNNAGQTAQGVAEKMVEQEEVSRRMRDRERHQKEERKAHKLETEKDHSELTAFLRENGLDDLVDILFARKFKYVAEVKRLTEKDLRRMGVKDREEREKFLATVEEHFEKIAEAERQAEEERTRELDRRARPFSKTTAVLALAGVFLAIYVCLRIIIYNRTSGRSGRHGYSGSSAGLAVWLVMSRKRSFNSSVAQPTSAQDEMPRYANVLCCVCGASMQPNQSNMCVNCMKGEVDITEGISKQAVVNYCRECNRYQRPPWVACEPESRELLGICLKKIKGLNKVKLVDANFIWQAPTSKRMKVKLTVQKEVMNGAIMQQSMIVDFIVAWQQCDDCKRTYTPHTWNASVQVRQKTDHKRTFYYLEQLILKHDAHEKVVGIKRTPDGLDFHFGHRSHAQKFTEFVLSQVPSRVKQSKHLISHDSHNTTYNYKYTTLVDMCPVCKDDVVFLPKALKNKLGGVNPIQVVTKVSSQIRLVDPLTGKVSDLAGIEYWKNPFDPLLTRRHLVEFTVLNVDEDIGPARGSAFNKRGAKTYNMVDLELMRTQDCGEAAAGDPEIITVRSHLGGVLQPGDLCAGYDLRTVNVSGIDEEMLEKTNLDVIIVKKTYTRHRQRKRPWILRRLEREDAGGEESNDGDYEQFMRDIEEDKDLRQEINLFRDPAWKEPAAAPSREEEEDDDDENEAPEVDLAELLDGLTLNDKGPADIPAENGDDDDEL
ncbi:ribosome-binding protein [Perkinsus chesapeaki]|uniref:60S ribosomal export protein NMD3 n=1 Tax=Perkinsus chesapeaki TaxID=330153 RepID=A0A7J6MZ82_PERCH|nr:ribosome-binding protein [Perkinsus chesapeaki]